MKNFLIFVIAALCVLSHFGADACKLRCDKGKYKKASASSSSANKGTTPVARPNFQKKANGCGSKGITVNPKLLPAPQFLQCCNNHDFCYDTCNSVKANCDVDFKNCMMSACGKKISCKITANVFYDIVKNAGCSSYIDAQKRACICT